MSESPARKPSVIRKRFPWGWVVLGVVGLALVGMVVAARNAPVTVAVSAPTVFKAGEGNPLVTASGYLVARTRATLSSKVLGRVSWLGVQEGSRVTKGQVLAWIRPFWTWTGARSYWFWASRMQPRWIACATRN